MKSTARGGSATQGHNAHLYESDRATFDPGRAADNVFFRTRLIDGKNKTVRCEADKYQESVFKTFERVFKAHLAAQNERYTKGRHPECVRDMKSLFDSNKGRHEFLFQLGTQDEHPSRNTLTRAWANTFEELKKLYGKNVVLLGAAVHADEATPHVHMEVAFRAHDKGIDVPNKTKALQEMGFTLPDPTKPRGRYNNELMSFSSYMQDLFHAKAKELGLDLDEINHNGTRRKHLDTLSFKVEQETAHLQHLQAETAIEEQRLQNVRQDIEDAKNAAPQSFKLKTQQNHHMNELEKDQAVLRCVEELAPDIVRQARAGVQSHRKSVDMPTRSR
jgi:hypothetical protein